MVFELPALQCVIERINIIDIVVGIANAFDKQDWQKLRNYLADEIYIDYSELRQELPKQVTAEAYVQQRVTSLTGLKTLHISTNHEVTINENNAQCWSAYRIYRLDPEGKTEQNQLNTVGNYQHQFVQVEGIWKLTAIKQTVILSSGDRRIHKELIDA